VPLPPPAGWLLVSIVGYRIHCFFFRAANPLALPASPLQRSGRTGTPRRAITRGNRLSHRIAAKITGVAAFVPPTVQTNADLEKTRPPKAQRPPPPPLLPQPPAPAPGHATPPQAKHPPNAPPKKTHPPPPRNRSHRPGQRHARLFFSRHCLPHSGPHRRKKRL